MRTYRDIAARDRAHGTAGNAITVIRIRLLARVCGVDRLSRGLVLHPNPRAAGRSGRGKVVSASSSTGIRRAGDRPDHAAYSVLDVRTVPQQQRCLDSGDWNGASTTMVSFNLASLDWTVKGTTRDVGQSG